MSTTRRWMGPVLLAGLMGLLVLLAAPASADVNCADLRTSDAAQAYFDGRTGDPDQLDGDHDGRACEGDAPAGNTTWILIGLGLLFAAGLASFSRDTTGAPRNRLAVEVAEEVPTAVELRLVPALEVISEKAEIDASPSADDTNHSGVSMPIQKKIIVAKASTGSISELARALRLVPYGERMAVLEGHASARGATPREVLADLAEHTSDLELQGWALAGYDPPWTVRVMRCSACVDGMRNFRLQTAEDGSHFWACATCHTPDRHLT